MSRQVGQFFFNEKLTPDAINAAWKHEVPAPSDAPAT